MRTRGIKDIPLYNCYWCKCAYCLNYSYCEVKRCYECKMIHKKNKLPYLKKECNNFIDRYEERSIRKGKCKDCEYKKKFSEIEKIMKEHSTK